MRIFVDGNLPKAMGLTRAELKAAAQLFAARSSARIGVPFREVTVVLQDDSASDAAHRAIMNVAGATDVITQGYEAIPPEPEGIYGELYVNCDQALRVAPKCRGWSPAKELLLYVAHGMDHLSGADDHSPRDYARMRRRELNWLKEAMPVKELKPAKDMRREKDMRHETRDANRSPVSRPKSFMSHVSRLTS